MGDENLVRALRQIDRIMIRKSKQNRQHSDVHIDQITDAFPHQRPHVTGELLTPFEQDEVECFFGAQVLVYQLFDLPDQLGVLEDRQLDVKDCCFLRPGILFGASSHLLQARTRTNKIVLIEGSSGWIGSYTNVRLTGTTGSTFSGIPVVPSRELSVVG